MLEHSIPRAPQEFSKGDAMAQGASMSMDKVTTGEKIVLGSAGLYFIWAFIPVWYKFSIDLGPLGSFGVSTSINGLRGVTFIAWLLAIVAIAEIVLRSIMGMNVNLPAKPGLIHLAVAGLALLLTLLGFIAKPTGFGISWGLFVALIFAVAWTYGAYMMYSAPDTTPMAPPADSHGGRMS
jgi:hypothetical protein